MSDVKSDAEFRDLHLRSICPGAEQWPEEYHHQKRLKSAAIETREFLRHAYAEFDAIDGNADLSPEGKRRLRAEAARNLIATFESLNVLSNARATAEDVVQKYKARIKTKLQPATDPQAVGIHTQIRGQLLAIKDPKERMSFLGRNGKDITLISAALSAPPYLSGLSDAEVVLLQKNLEKHAAPEVINERDFVRKALAEIERGGRAAQSRIAKRGGFFSERIGKSAQRGECSLIN
jgi:hypothetical protein